MAGDVSKKRRPWYAFIKGGVAASLLILLSFLAAYYWVKLETKPAQEQPQWIVKENPYGQRSTIFLSDGTEVILNAGSRITYRDQFSNDEREVMLRGEAFFEVARDTLRPFKVVAQNIVTQALGTSFNVQAFPSEPIRVSLVSGKVSVNDKSLDNAAALILQPGESAVYDAKKSAEISKQSFDAQRALAWKEGIIYFEEADEKTVFTTLERWYGVRIETLGESPKVWDFTGEVKNMSLNQFLRSLSYTMDFDYQINNKQVTIDYHE